MYILGISSYYHDSSVCLFKNGDLLFACEEEKFSGVKHDSRFPILAIKYITEKYNLNKNNIECVCYYEKPSLRFKRKKSFFKSIINYIKVWYNLRKISDRIFYTPHHLSHMAYSFFSSDYTKAMVVSVDGVGETTTLSIGEGDGNKIKQLYTFEYPHSLGLFYSAMTAFLGFKPNEGEYKLMGLASYGDPNVYKDEMNDLISYQNKKLKCNMNVFSWDKSEYTMFTHDLENLLDIEARNPQDKITDDHKDIAAAVQWKYEDIFFKILKEAKKEINLDNLCLGGGCAYNGKANGKLIDDKLFKHLWIPPAPSDAGSSIGSCLYYLSTVKNKRIKLSPNPFLGPSYDENTILETLLKYKLVINYRKLDKTELYRKVANYLKLGYVIGWFQDRIEFGARALGNRSILADPTLDYMKDRINSMVKRREGFRPFAPMVTYEDQNKFFESKEYIPYMNQIVRVKPEYIKILNAVTHVDGTARVQSVLPSNDIYELLKEFEILTGYPILLNTSFNLKDKTMVLTPEDALQTFLDSQIDFLVINNYIINKH